MLEPRSFGLTFDPPSITLVYVTAGKTRKRTMPVRGLTADTEAAAAAAALQSAHATLLAPDIVSTEQLQRLIEKLIKHKQQRRQKRLAQGQQPLSEREGSSRRREGDATPSSSFGSDRSRHDGDGESAVDSFSRPPAAATPDGRGSGGASVGARESGKVAEAAGEKPRPRAGESQCIGDSELPVVDPSLDLNKVSEEELKKHKEAMAETFEANRVRPGDPGYVHDKRVEFEGEKEDNEWDDEISDFESEVDEFEELLKGL